MTIERAKEVLKEQIELYGIEYDNEGIEALEFAIDVLKKIQDYDDSYDIGYSHGYSDAIYDLAEGR